MIDKHGTIYVDNTLLTSLACSTRALLRHHHGYTVPGLRAKLKAGHAGHEALAVWFKEGGDKEAALARFAAEYKDFSDECVDPDYAECHQNVSEILGAWFDDRKLRDFPLRVEPGNVEVGLQIPLTDECVCGRPELQHGGGPGGVDHEYRPAFIFYGRLDLFGHRWDDSSLWICDHKLTGRVSRDYLDSYKMDSQMSGYVWAAEQTLGRRVEGVYINAIQAFQWLPGRDTPGKKCYKHKTPYEDCRTLHAVWECVPYRRDPAELEEWRNTAIHLARRYRDLVRRFPDIVDLPRVRTQGKFFRECRWCEFNEFCESGRPVEYVDSMLMYEPWRPFDPESED